MTWHAAYNPGPSVGTWTLSLGKILVRVYGLERDLLTDSKHGTK